MRDGLRLGLQQLVSRQAGTCRAMHTAMQSLSVSQDMSWGLKTPSSPVMAEAMCRLQQLRCAHAPTNRAMRMHAWKLSQFPVWQIVKQSCHLVHDATLPLTALSLQGEPTHYSWCRCEPSLHWVPAHWMGYPGPVSNEPHGISTAFRLAVQRLLCTVHSMVVQCTKPIVLTTCVTAQKPAAWYAKKLPGKPCLPHGTY